MTRRLTLLLAVLPLCVSRSPAAEPCTRPHIGGIVADPPELRSANGALAVEFSFETFTDHYGRARYCYVAANGAQSPTLRVRPGDRLTLRLKNNLPANPAVPPRHHDMTIQGPCGAGRMTPATTNLHFHGLSIPPACRADEVISTMVQPSPTAFEYRFQIPPHQPPGLYWYHPHPHGFSEAQVLGGASGALIVEGIEQVKPQVSALPERILVLRDQVIPDMPDEAGETRGPQPAKDISLNFVAVMYPADRPAAMVAQPGRREFWRVLNAAADTYFQLQIRTGPSLREARTPLPLELIALDGAPADPHAAAPQAAVLLPPGARAEFIVTTPPEGTFAQLVTLPYDTGPSGESTPLRVIANFFSTRQAPEPAARLPQSTTSEPAPFTGLTAIAPARERLLYFSEKRRNPADPASPLDYFVTVEGDQPKPFDSNFTVPDIIVRQGTVEDWVIQNRAPEAHAFHIHQVHFQVLERDGRVVNEPALRDTVDLPYWDGKSPRYPRLKLRLDFRDPQIVGTFLYHCHILEHEDRGMMGTIRVDPR